MLNIKIRYLLYASYLNLFSFAFFNPLFALYVIHIGARPEYIGIAWGVNMYAAAAMILLFGKFEDKRKNKEKLVIAGYFILAIGAFSYIWVTSLWQLFIVQVINAVGIGILTPAWRTTYALNEDKGKESLEWSFVDGGGRFFIATGAIVGSLLYKYYGFKTIFILIGIIQLIAAFLSLKLLNHRN